MSPIGPGSPAPPVRGVDLSAGPVALFFYKVTCPVCRQAAPKATAFERAYPGRVVGVGQDPEGDLEAFSREWDMAIRSIVDAEPYEASNAYGIEVVPTLVLVGEGGVVDDVVQAWDRDGYNRVSLRLAELTGREYAVVSDPGDGLPPFRPG